MKNTLIIFAILLSMFVNAQESILDKGAIKTCEYLNSEAIIGLDLSDKTAKLGVFLITYYMDNKKEFIKEGHEIELSESGGSELGEKIGMKMFNYCPDVVMALAGDDESDAIDEQSRDYAAEGDITSISGTDFNYVHLKNVNGKMEKFLWFQNFIGSEKLMNLNKVKNKKVRITFIKTECYSPKLQEYIIMKQIKEVEFL